MKLLHFHLEDYGARQGAYPISIEEGIKNGLLDDFPEERNRYLQQAMNEGRLSYIISDTGNFRIQLITNLNREIVFNGQKTSNMKQMPNKSHHATSGSGGVDGD